MTKQEILDSIKSLAFSQGFYGSLYEKLSNNSKESNEILDKLESLNLKDSVDLVMYLEA